MGLSLLCTFTSSRAFDHACAGRFLGAITNVSTCTERQTSFHTHPLSRTLAEKRCCNDSAGFSQTVQEK